MAFFLPNSKILLSLPFSNPYGCFLHCLKVHNSPLFCLLTVRLTASCSALYGVTFKPLHFVFLLKCSLSTFAFLWYFAFLSFFFSFVVVPGLWKLSLTVTLENPQLNIKDIILSHLYRTIHL